MIDSFATSLPIGVHDLNTDATATTAPVDAFVRPTADQNRIQEVRRAATTGKLSAEDLHQISNNTDEDLAQAFLEGLSENLQSTQLKLDLGQDGISLSDHSDVGAGLRFETYSDKASHVSDRFGFLTDIVTSSILSPNANFADLFDFSEPPPDQSFNNPSIRDALAVNIPVALGGTSNVVVGLAETSADEWLQLLENIPISVET